MISNEQFRTCPKPTRQFMYKFIEIITNTCIRWDYRSNEYPGDPKTERHPNDLSVQTFIGHKVLRTLIRCRFSPEQTTGFIHSLGLLLIVY